MRCRGERFSGHPTELSFGPSREIHWCSARTPQGRRTLSRSLIRCRGRGGGDHAMRRQEKAYAALQAGGRRLAPICRRRCQT